MRDCVVNECIVYLPATAVSTGLSVAVRNPSLFVAAALPPICESYRVSVAVHFQSYNSVWIRFTL